MDLDLAVATIARHILATAATDAEWDCYPEIGEYDWEEVCVYLQSNNPFPDADQFAAASTYLEARVEQP
jgi:hypothetical protein